MRSQEDQNFIAPSLDRGTAEPCSDQVNCSDSLLSVNRGGTRAFPWEMRHEFGDIKVGRKLCGYRLDLTMTEIVSWERHTQPA